jgi:hypothetical protein
MGCALLPLGVQNLVSALDRRCLISSSIVFRLVSFVVGGKRVSRHRAAMSKSDQLLARLHNVAHSTNNNGR